MKVSAGINHRPMPAKTLIVIACLALVIVFACKKSSNNDAAATDPVATYLNLPATPYNYANPPLPAYLATPVIQGQINPGNTTITDRGATLGRVLFYDKNLSINKTIACASCHKQENAFSDNTVLSTGFNGGLTGRNSMSLIDAKYYPSGRYFWDQRAATLEEQTLTPVQDHVEMGMTLAELETRLKSLPYYPVLFTQAFGDANITSNRVALSLAQFVRAIISYQSRYDEGRQAFPAAPAPPPNIPFTNFTAQENRGKELFFTPQTGCVACHGSETFTAPTEKNNGLDLINTDRGFGAVTGNAAQDGLFKVGSLRNVELTAPYMHDGRFATLEQVIDHYNTGVMNNPNLSQQLRLPNNLPRQLNLSVQDKAALVAFLKTLTDRNVTTDVKFSNPFR